MAVTKGYAATAGTLKAAELGHDYVDGLTGIVAVTVSTGTISGGNFTLQTGATLTDWPTTGTFTVGGRLFTYGGKSGANLTSCNGAYGDLAAVTIAADDVIYQGVPASVMNLLLADVIPFRVYRARAQSGLNVTCHGGVIIDGTTELAYAGGTLALTDAATNWVYMWNNAGTLTLAKNTTSIASAKTAGGGKIWLLAKIVCAAGTWGESNYTDLRAALLGDAVQSIGDVVGPASVTDTAIPIFDGTTGKLLKESNWRVSNTADLLEILTASGAALVVFGTRVSGDVGRRFYLNAGGSHFWGTGGAGDTELSRIAAGVLGMGAGNAFRIGTFGEFIESAAPATPASGYTRTYAKTDGKLYKLNDAAVEVEIKTGPEYIYIQAGAGTAAVTAINIGQAATFDDTGARENDVFVVQMPANWDGGAVEITALGQSQQAMGGTTAHLGVEIGVQVDGDNPASPTYGTAVTVNQVCNSTGGLGTYKLETTTFAAVSPGGSTPLGNKALIIRFYRDSSNGSDDYGGKYLLNCLRIEYDVT